MTFNGAVNVDVASETETYGTVNSGVIDFTSATAPVSFTVANVCNPPDHPNCADVDVYGIRNFGTVNVAGGLTVSTTAGGTGAAYSIWSVPIDIQDASVTVNQAGGQRVQLDGDIATATETVNGKIGSVDVNFDTSDSWLRGLIGGHQTDAGEQQGQPIYTDLELARTTDGQPFSGEDQFSAFANFTFTGPDGATWAHFVECRWIEQGQSVLVVVQDVPQDKFGAERPARRQIQNSIEIGA